MQPCQLGFIVDDLPAAVARWKALLGVEPQIVEVSPHAIAQTRYRGREQPVTATLAFFRGGPMEIELILDPAMDLSKMNANAWFEDAYGAQCSSPIR